MGSFARSVKRSSQVLRKDRIKHNTKGKRVGPARTPSIGDFNRMSSGIHMSLSVVESVVDEEIGIPPPNKSCKHCKGTGIAGQLVDQDNQKLVCVCVVKNLTFRKEPENGDSQQDGECPTT